ncbi:hypothetical protein H4R21_002798, partial [Coemansia helicoidea]
MDPSGGGDGASDDFVQGLSHAAGVFGAGGANGSGGISDGGFEDLWGIGDAASMFFNMDAFSSAPATGGGSGPLMAGGATLAADSGSASTADLFGFDMGGTSMDADALKLILQGDTSMDELLGGLGTSAGGGAAVPAAGPMVGATLAPADLDAMAAASSQPAAVTVKSPTPLAKKPRPPKAKKAAAPKADRPSKAKAKKAATPKLKSPTPQPADAARTGPTSPASDTVRRIKPKADSIASPTPSAKSITAAAAAAPPPRAP